MKTLQLTQCADISIASGEQSQANISAVSGYSGSQYSINSQSFFSEANGKRPMRPLFLIQEANQEVNSAEKSLHTAVETEQVKQFTLTLEESIPLTNNAQVLQPTLPETFENNEVTGNKSDQQVEQGQVVDVQTVVAEPISSTSNNQTTQLLQPTILELFQNKEQIVDKSDQQVAQVQKDGSPHSSLRLSAGTTRAVILGKEQHAPESGDPFTFQSTTGDTRDDKRKEKTSFLESNKNSVIKSSQHYADSSLTQHDIKQPGNTGGSGGNEDSKNKKIQKEDSCFCATF